MAARKTPPPRKPGTTPSKPAPRKTAAATKMGYTGKNAAAAAKSVTAQYGLVKNEQGAWVRVGIVIDLGDHPSTSAGSVG